MQANLGSYLRARFAPLTSKVRECNDLGNPRVSRQVTNRPIIARISCASESKPPKNLNKRGVSRPTFVR